MGFCFPIAGGIVLIWQAFAWPAGAGDTAVGLLAPIVGLAFAQRSRRARGMGARLESVVVHPNSGRLARAESQSPGLIAASTQGDSSGRSDFVQTR